MSIVLVMGKMQIQTTLIFHVIPIRTDKTIDSSCSCESGLLEHMQTCTTTMEICVMGLWKVGN